MNISHWGDLAGVTAVLGAVGHPADAVTSVLPPSTVPIEPRDRKGGGTAGGRSGTTAATPAPFGRRACQPASDRSPLGAGAAESQAPRAGTLAAQRGPK